jgi:hypothetical protein
MSAILQNEMTQFIMAGCDGTFEHSRSLKDAKAG